MAERSRGSHAVGVIQALVSDELATLARLVAGEAGEPRPRIAIDALVEAAGRVDPDDLPILSMLVHGTSPADIAGVLGIGESELAGRRQRMLTALLGEHVSR